nr:hypothetical protein [Desulforamulus aquiferis]
MKQDLNFRQLFEDSTRGDFQMICAKIIFYLRTGKLAASIVPSKAKDKEWIYGTKVRSNKESRLI